MSWSVFALIIVSSKFRLWIGMLHGEMYIVIQPIIRRQIFYSSKLKKFADDNFKFDENGRKLTGRNTVGKGEIAHYEQFFLFPQCFQKACFPGASKGVIGWEWVKTSIHTWYFLPYVMLTPCLYKITKIITGWSPCDFAPHCPQLSLISVSETPSNTIGQLSITKSINNFNFAWQGLNLFGGIVKQNRTEYRTLFTWRCFFVTFNEH